MDLGRARQLLPLLLACLTGPSSGEPVRLIIDTDMSTDVDDVGALCMAHKLQDMGEAEIIGIVHNTGLPSGVGVLSAINEYYGRGYILLGAYKGDFDNPYGPDAENDEWYTTRAAGPYAEDLVEKFRPPIRERSQVWDAVKLYRAVLAGPPDGSVVIASIGFLTNLAALLKSGPDSDSLLRGVDLVKRKVRLLTVMGGKYPSSAPDLDYEWNFGGGCQWGSPQCPYTPAWTADVLRLWPKTVPVVFSGAEIGPGVLTGGRLPSCVPVDNPCRFAYEMYGKWDTKCPPRASWDIITVLYAIRGEQFWGEQHWGGHNTVDPATGSNAWVDGPRTNQSYLVLKRGANETLAAKIDELLCMPPSRLTRMEPP